MARMTSADMLSGHSGPVNSITGTHRPLSPADSADWSSRGAAVPPGQQPWLDTDEYRGWPTDAYGTDR